MSDVHCAAQLLVARHGQAEYDDATLRDSGGSLTLAGRAQARALAEGLRGRSVALIYCSDLARAVQTAEIAAGVLGVPVRVRPALREFAVGSYAGRVADEAAFQKMFETVVGSPPEGGIPGGETVQQILTRVSTELESIADAHRGETVLVVTHNGVACCALPRLAENLPPRYGLTHPLAEGAVVELAGDADGWVVRSWAGNDLTAAASSA